MNDDDPESPRNVARVTGARRGSVSERLPAVAAGVFMLAVLVWVIFASSRQTPSIAARCAQDAFGCAVIEPGGTILIGFGAPIQVSFGTDAVQAANLAVEDHAQVQGFAVALLVEDDGGTTQGGAAVARQFAANSQVVAVAGHIYSDPTEAAIPIYESAGIPMMSPSATYQFLTRRNSIVFNRLAFTDTVQGRVTAEYLYQTLGFKRIAIVYDGSPYGLGLAQVVFNRFDELGGTVTGRMIHAVEPGQADYSTLLGQLAAGQPQALYFGGFVEEAARIAAQMDQVGLGEAVFFGSDGAFGEEFLQRAGEHAEGAYAVSLSPPESSARQAFDERYLQAYGTPAGTLSTYTWNYYDAVAVLVHAVEQVAETGQDGSLYIPRGELVTAVRGTRAYEGLTGSISCNGSGECSASGPSFYVVRGGVWQTP